MTSHDNTMLMMELIRCYTHSSLPSKFLTEEDISYCVDYGLGPILAEMYLNHSKNLSDAQKKQFAAMQLTAKYYAASYNSATSELLNLLSENQLVVVLLKGIFASNNLYDNSHLRLMGDIDILVKKVDSFTIANILLSCGYTQESDMPDSFYIDHQHLKPFYHPKNNIWLEVHTCLFSKLTAQGKRKLYQPNVLFHEITPIKYKDFKNVYTLRSELNLHYTITHWVREFKISNSIIQLVDITLIIKRSEINWDKFIDYIKTRDQATEVKLVFRLLKKNKLISIDEHIYKLIISTKDSMGPVGKWILEKIIHGYLSRNNFIIQVIGDTNCSRIWYSYLRDKSSVKNNIHMLRMILLPNDLEEQSIFDGIKLRIINLYKRFTSHYNP